MIKLPKSLEKMSIQNTIGRMFPEAAVRRYLVILALLFAAAFPAGLFATHPVFKEIAKMFAGMMAPFGDLSGGNVFLLVLVNNVFASLVMLMSGLLAGVLPVVSVGFNGFAMGLICRHLSATAGYGAALLDLAPHAVFEIPALLIVASYGLWLGIGTVRRLRGKEARTIPDMLNHAVERYFTLVFPLLVGAAAAETILYLRGG